METIEAVTTKDCHTVGRGKSSAEVFSSGDEAVSTTAVYADKKLMQTWIVDMDAVIGDTDKMEEQMKMLEQKLNVPYIGIAKTTIP